MCRQSFTVAAYQIDSLISICDVFHEIWEEFHACSSSTDAGRLEPGFSSQASLGTVLGDCRLHRK
jgi:hypothetical protein